MVGVMRDCRIDRNGTVVVLVISNMLSEIWKFEPKGRVYLSDTLCEIMGCRVLLIGIDNLNVCHCYCHKSQLCDHNSHLGRSHPYLRHDSHDMVVCM